MVLRLPSRLTVAAFTGVLAGAIVIPRLVGWVTTDRLIELSALVLAAMLATCLREQEPTAANRAIMPPAFLVIFSALMLMGGRPAMFVAAAAALTPGFVTRRVAPRQAIIDAGVGIVAVQAADLTHLSIVSLLPRVYLWPWL